ncbi:MAG: ABC transporter substrate-binding protein [Clostridiaceae bacterium]|nr:ABC transporter substrate-binding protein [Clostridiaceae bacterium]
MKTKRLPALLLAACLCLPLGSCAFSAKDPAAGEQNGPTQEEKAPAKDSLVIAISSEPSTLNPYDHSAVVCGYMNQMTFNKLFTIDLDTLEPVPELVESYSCSDDGLNWSFKLKEGVKFHNGEEMTAEDVCASLEYAKTFAFCTRYTSFWTSLEPTGTYSFEITTVRPYSQALYDLSANSACIVPKSLIESGNDFNANPVGTGPYIFSSKSSGDSITFTKNEDYFDQSHMPEIKTLTWKIIPEGSSRTIGLETGEIDLVIDVEPSDIERLQTEDGINVLSLVGTRINFMAMNSEKAPFDNIYFRKAINAAVDRQAVSDVASGGLGAVSVSPNPQVYPGSTLENTTDYSPSLARKYLGISEVDTQSLVVKCLCYSDETRRSAEVIQAYLREVGITMEIESLDFAAFLSNMLDGNYECAVAGYSSTNMLTYMKGLWSSASIGASNASRIKDAELDSLIDLAQTQLDEDERNETLLEICRRTNELSLLLPLYTSSVTRAYSSDLTGVKASSSGLMIYQDLRFAN